MTTLELTAFLTRNGQSLRIPPPPPPPPPPRSEKPQRESELHRLINQDIKRRGWICCHGAMHTATKRTPGEPDYHVLAPKGRHFMVECKTATGKLSDDQVWFSNAASELGHSVWVVRSFEEWCRLASVMQEETK